jgi:hypothetical protein
MQIYTRAVYDQLLVAQAMVRKKRRQGRAVAPVTSCATWRLFARKRWLDLIVLESVLMLLDKPINMRSEGPTSRTKSVALGPGSFISPDREVRIGCIKSNDT